MHCDEYEGLRGLNALTLESIHWHVYISGQSTYFIYTWQLIDN